MKKIFAKVGFIALLILTSAVQAQEILHFDESGYDAVLARARKEHKPVFYMIHADWCPHCQKMKAEVFTDQAVKDFYNKNFICAWQDIDKGEGSMLRDKFNIKYFPTFIYLDENGTVIYAVNGELKAAEIIAEGQTALTPEKQLPYLQQKFLKDPSNADNCLEYIMALRKDRDRVETAGPADIYLKTQKDEQLVSAVNWRIIANAVTDVDAREFQYVLKHTDDFAKVSSKPRVQRKIVNMISETLRPFTESLDTINYKKARNKILNLKLKSGDSLVFKSDMLISENTSNWGNYRKTAKAGVEKFAWDNAKLLKEIAQNYEKHINDNAALKDAIKWALHSEELTESYDGYLALAKLYIKINDKKSAIEYAKKARQMTVSLGWNSKDADALFQQLGITDK